MSILTEEIVRERLGSTIQADNSLFNLGHYIAWKPGNEFITLDCSYFDADELEAIVWWMRNKGAK